MNETRIEDLLREADRMAGPPPMGPADLADRVRRLQVHRRRMVVTTGGAIAALVAVSIGAGIFLVGRPNGSAMKERPISVAKISTSAPDAQAELNRLRAQIEELRAEADSALALARQAAALQEQQSHLAELKRMLARGDPRDEVRRQMDTAAFTMVYQADRMYRELKLRAPAAESYRRVIALFPDTPSAKVARQRLSEIEGSKGDKL